MRRRTAEAIAGGLALAATVIGLTAVFGIARWVLGGG